MKLFYIVNARIPTEKAHGIQIMQMCSAFSKYNPNVTNDYTNTMNRDKKIEVELVVPHRFNHIKEDPFRYYGIERNFKIKRLPCLDLIPLEKYLGRLTFWIQSATFYISVFFYLLLTSNVKRRTSNIIYTRDILFAPFSLFWNNIIYEAHSFPNHFSLYKLFLKKLKGIVIITNNLKKLFVNYGILEDKLIVAPDAVDVKMFNVRASKSEAREKLGLPEDKKIIIYAGHLYQENGPQVLALSSKYLPNNYLIFFIGGTKNDILSFKRLYSNSNIVIIGYRQHDEIPYWLKAADVLVAPYIPSDKYVELLMSPLKVFEYMVARKPIVVSDLPSIREVLNEKNAILVKPNDPKALAKGIRTALDSPGFMKRIAEQAFQDAQRYTWDKRAEKILSFSLKI